MSFAGGIGVALAAATGAGTIDIDPVVGSAAVAGAAAGVAAASAPVPGERAETGQQQQHYAPQAEDTAAAHQLDTVLDSIAREMSILCSTENIIAGVFLFLK